MKIVLRANKRDKLFFLAIISALFVAMFWIIIEAGINQGDLFSRDALILIGLWGIIFAFVVASTLCQKMELTDMELKYLNQYFVSKRVKLSDIKAANITYGEKMSRRLLISIEGGKAIDIPLGIWSEDAFVRLFNELKKRNPAIDFDDRYDSAISALGKPEYESERKKVEMMHNKDVGRWALWAIIGALTPIALIIIGGLFGLV